MPNRVERGIAALQTKIDELDGVGLNGRPLSEVEDECTLTFQEFVAFQNQQAIAHASGILSTDEASTVYRLLGGECHADNGNGGWPTGVTLAQKMTVNQLMGELMTRRRR